MIRAVLGQAGRCNSSPTAINGMAPLVRRPAKAAAPPSATAQISVFCVSRANPGIALRDSH